MHGNVKANYYLNYISTCIFFSLFSRILDWFLLELLRTPETLVITTIHIVAIQERNRGRVKSGEMWGTQDLVW